MESRYTEYFESQKQLIEIVSCPLVLLNLDKAITDLACEVHEYVEGVVPVKSLAEAIWGSTGPSDVMSSANWINHRQAVEIRPDRWGTYSSPCYSFVHREPEYTIFRWDSIEDRISKDPKTIMEVVQKTALYIRPFRREVQLTGWVKAHVKTCIHFPLADDDVALLRKMKVIRLSDPYISTAREVVVCER